MFSSIILFHHGFSCLSVRKYYMRTFHLNDDKRQDISRVNGKNKNSSLLSVNSSLIELRFTYFAKAKRIAVTVKPLTVSQRM